MKAYRKSLRRINQLVKESTKAGRYAYRIVGRGPFDIVEVDNLNRQVTLIEVRARRSATFRIDQDMRRFPDITLMTRRVTYDGKVKE